MLDWEKNAPPRYLTAQDWEAEKHIEVVSLDRMLDEGLTLHPEFMIEVLTHAKNFLDTYPGPSLEVRRSSSGEWLGYWIEFYSHIKSRESGLYIPSRKIKRFEAVNFWVNSDTLYQKLCGALPVAGFEGHPGHRYMMEQILTGNYFPVIIFEQDEYFKRFKDRMPYLPLPIRLALCDSMVPLIGCVTVNPSIPNSSDNLDMYYLEQFKKTGVRISFVDERDPYLISKAARGRKGIVMKHLETLSTSERARWMLPHERTEEMLTELIYQLAGIERVKLDSPIDMKTVEYCPF